MACEIAAGCHLKFQIFETLTFAIIIIIIIIILLFNGTQSTVKIKASVNYN